jgi:hypothetical protein
MTPFPSCHMYRIQYDNIGPSPTSEFTHSVVDDIVPALDRAIECKSRLDERTTRGSISGFVLRLRVQRYVHVVQNLFQHLRRRQSGRLRQGLVRPEEILLVGNLERRRRRGAWFTFAIGSGGSSRRGDGAIGRWRRVGVWRIWRGRGRSSGDASDASGSRLQVIPRVTRGTGIRETSAC